MRPRPPAVHHRALALFRVSCRVASSRPVSAIPADLSQRATTTDHPTADSRTAARTAVRSRSSLRVVHRTVETLPAAATARRLHSPTMTAFTVRPPVTVRLRARLLVPMEHSRPTVLRLLVSRITLVRVVAPQATMLSPETTDPMETPDLRDRRRPSQEISVRSGRLQTSP